MLEEGIELIEVKAINFRKLVLTNRAIRAVVATKKATKKLKENAKIA